MACVGSASASSSFHPSGHSLRPGVSPTDERTTKPDQLSNQRLIGLSSRSASCAQFVMDSLSYELPRIEGAGCN